MTRNTYWFVAAVLVGFLSGGVGVAAQGGIAALFNLRGSSTLTGSVPSLNVAILDASGVQITSFGGGTQYAEDSGATNGQLVTAAGVVQLATPADTASDAEYTWLQTSGGLLWVRPRGLQDSGGTDMTDTTLHALKMSLLGSLPAGTNAIGAVTGGKSNNGGVPGATNLGVLPCIANASAPSWTEGNEVNCSVDLSGGLRISGSATDSDDASVASGQSSLALTIPLAYRYNLSAWVREVADPCSYVSKIRVPFSISSATTTQLIAASASNYNYICDIDLFVSAADNVALVEDDTSACASPTAGMAGGVTAATGWNFIANQGLAKGNGLGTVYKTAATNRYTCFITSSTAQVSGSLSFVQVP